MGPLNKTEVGLVKALGKYWVTGRERAESVLSNANESVDLGAVVAISENGQCITTA